MVRLMHLTMQEPDHFFCNGTFWDKQEFYRRDELRLYSQAAKTNLGGYGVSP